MPRVLSSPTTSFWRYVFPALWIGGFGVGTLALWLGAFHGRHGEPPPEFMRWLFPGVWLVGSSLLLRFARRLCDVSLHEDATLEVCRPGHQPERVPLSAVARVSQNRSNPPTITLHLRAADGPERRVVFLPEGPRRFFSEYPVTAELRALARRRLPSVLPGA